MLLDQKKQSGLLQSRRRAEVLADHVRHEISLGRLKTGDRVAAVRTLASQFGMSVHTVREGLAILVGEKVLEDRGGKKYVLNVPSSAPVPSPVLSSPGAELGQVALMVDRNGHFHDEICPALIHNLSVQQIPCVTVPAQYASDPSSLDPWLKRWKIRPPHAVVVGFSHPVVEERLNDVCAGRSRIIALYQPTPYGLGWHQVYIDFTRMGRIAVDYFLGRGRRCVGIMTGGRYMDPLFAQPEPAKRRASHTPLILSIGRELRQLGLRNSLSVHYVAKQESYDDPSREKEIQRIIAWLSQANRPTAIVGSDYHLVMVFTAMNHMGLELGKDIDLLGFGQTPWSQAYGFPSLNLQPSVFARCLAQLIGMDVELMGDTVFAVKVPPRIKSR